MFEMKLPDIGEGIAEAELVCWKIKAGQVVAENEPLAEFLTDKASVDIPSPVHGKVSTLLYEEGEIVTVGKVFIQIDDLVQSTKVDQEQVIQKKSISKVMTSENKEMADHPPEIPPRPGYNIKKDTICSAIIATPAVRKEAKDLGIDLHKIKGSGADGRVTHADLVSQIKPTSSGPKPFVFPKDNDEEDWSRQSFRGLRRMIADNMHRSKQLIPHFTYVEEVDLTKLEGKRENSSYRSPLAFIALACIESLKEYKVLNSTLDILGSEMILKNKIHLGIAVATPEGLIVPVVHDAAHKNLDELNQSIAECSEKAKEGKCKSKDLKGGTFTISSLGKFGGLMATPIIRYPEVAILGVHSIKKVPRFNTKGKVVEANIVNLSLSVDHRIADGIVAAKFMQHVKTRLEQSNFSELEE